MSRLGALSLSARFGLAIVTLYALAALFAPVIAPYGEAEVVAGAFAPPSAELPLGADQLGRDMVSRLIHGARNSVGLALAATLIAFTVGAGLGMLAALRGGWTDLLLGRAADVAMSIPALILALLLLSIFGAGAGVLVLAAGLAYAPRVFRLTRAVAAGLVALDYVEAARLRGEGALSLMRRELLPNAAGPLAAEFGLEFCFVFLLLAALSFLGLGLQPPAADWGAMVRENAVLISAGDARPLYPAAAIALLTVGVNLLIDGAAAADRS